MHGRRENDEGCSYETYHQLHMRVAKSLGFDLEDDAKNAEENRSCQEDFRMDIRRGGQADRQTNR